MRSGRAVIAAVATALLLAGCSVGPSSVATKTYRGAPNGFDSSKGLSDGGQPGAMWLEGGGAFAIITFGSSSCPPVPTSVSVKDAHTIEVTFAQSPQKACTADFGPSTSEFTTPAGLEDPVTAELSFDFGEKHRYSVPIQG